MKSLRLKARSSRKGWWGDTDRSAKGMDPATQWTACPMCGFEFNRDDTLCEHGCPLGSLCNLVRCPNCAYEFPATLKRVSWLRSLLKRKSEMPSRLPENVKPVSALPLGTTATVLCLGGRTGSRYGTLSAFGLVAGSEITLLARRPACVVRIGETELALDPDIAIEVLVEPVGDAESDTHLH